MITFQRSTFARNRLPYSICYYGYQAMVHDQIDCPPPIEFVYLIEATGLQVVNAQVLNSSIDVRQRI